MVKSATGDAASANRTRQTQWQRRGQGPKQNGPREWVGGNAPERLGHCLARAMRLSAIQPRQCNAQRRGNDHVDHNGHDSRAGRPWPQQRHQQRDPHETGVRKGGHQRTKGRVVPADARIQAKRDGEADHDQGTQQVGREHPAIQQLRQRRARTKAEQHTGQRKKQHEAVQTRNRLQRQ